MELRPGHLLGHREDRHTGGCRHLTQVRWIGSALEDDGTRLGPFCVQQQLRRLDVPGRTATASTTTPGASAECSPSS